MKIVFFHSSMQAGGAERQISLFANYFAKNVEDTFIVTMDNQNSFYLLDDKIKHIKLDVAKNSKNFIESFINNRRRLKKVEKTFSEIRPDVVICFGSNTIYISKKARKKLNYKIIGSERTNPYFNQKGFWNKNKKKFAEYCTGYLFQTEGAKSFYSKKVQDNSITLGNAVLKEEFEKIDKNFENRKNFCAVGRLHKDKCFDEMIRAFEIVHQKHPEAILDIYGDGAERQRLQELICQLNLQDNVILQGKNPNVYGEYAKHKYFVMTSQREGFPNVLLEAMSSGCACVACDCDFGPSELIKNGENGLLLPLHNEQLLAEKICELIENENLTKKLADNAKKSREKYDIASIGKKFLEYIERVVGI